MMAKALGHLPNRKAVPKPHKMAITKARRTSGPETPQRGLRSQRVFVRSDATQLAELVGRVDAGHLTIDVADRRPLAEIAAVHADADAARLPGKTILTVG